jgi:hypothetical protein
VVRRIVATCVDLDHCQQGQWLTPTEYLSASERIWLTTETDVGENRGPTISYQGEPMGLGELVLLLLFVLLLAIGIRAMARHRNTTVRRVVLTIFGGLGIAGVLLYSCVLGQQAREDVAAASLGTPLRQVVPWLDRADAVARQVLSDSRQTIADSIKSIAHPSAGSATMSDFAVRRVGDQISVRMIVDWKGGFLGTANRTVVVWEFGESGHLRTALLEDSGAFGVGDSNKQQLDEYFRSEIYPVVRSRVGSR